MLAESVRSAGGLRTGTALLLADAVFAVAFAAGLSGSVAAVAEGRPELVGWLALSVTAACLRAVGGLLAAATSAASAGKAKLLLRQQLIGSAIALPAQAPSAHQTSGALMQRVVDDIEAFDAYLSRFVPARRAAAVAPLLLVAAAAVASPLAAGILAATLLAFLWC